MPTQIKQLTSRDIPQVRDLWQAATDQRREDLDIGSARAPGSVMDRPGAFGVGVVGDGHLLAIAIAMPARSDDGRSDRSGPGLAHISSVATRPGYWGKGLGGLAVRAIMSHAVRRGFARAQLWTQVSNAGARRLYEREGFFDLGRRKVDDLGEPILHFVRDLPQPPMLGRRAARVLCLDPDGKVLLMHWKDPVDGFCQWEPPGGGLEEGESRRAAVRREWHEETGLPLPDLAPEPTSVGRDVVWRGGRVVADEDFFLGTTAERAPAVDTAGFTDAEQVDGLGQAWVHWSALDELDDPVEPDLLPILRRLAPDGPWAAPNQR